MTERRDDHPVAVVALQRKRAEIAGLVGDLEKRLAAYRAALVHIDNALRLMGSPLIGDAIPARKPRGRLPYFVHGELTRRIYDALRASETVSGAELAEIAMVEKGLSDALIREVFVRRFLVRLAQLAGRGVIERITGGSGMRWRLKPPA